MGHCHPLELSSLPYKALSPYGASPPRGGHPAGRRHPTGYCPPLASSPRARCPPLRSSRLPGDRICFLVVLCSGTAPPSVSPACLGTSPGSLGTRSLFWGQDPQLSAGGQDHFCCSGTWASSSSLGTGSPSACLGTRLLSASLGTQSSSSCLLGDTATFWLLGDSLLPPAHLGGAHRRSSTWPWLTATNTKGLGLSPHEGRGGCGITALCTLPKASPRASHLPRTTVPEPWFGGHSGVPTPAPGGHQFPCAALLSLSTGGACSWHRRLGSVRPHGGTPPVPPCPGVAQRGGEDTPGTWLGEAGR